MKKFITILAFFSFFIINAIGQGNVSFTIKPVAGQNNKAKLFFRSNMNFSGSPSSFIFTFTLPASVLPQPIATLTGTGTYSYITYTLEPVNNQTVDGTNYHVYTFYAVPTTSTTQNIVANTEYEIAEITFTNVPDITTELRIVYLPNGGSNNLSGFYFEFNGNDMSNVASIFYGTAPTNFGTTTGYSFVGTSLILPVEFLSFYAVKSGNDAKLSWNVDGDETNAHFEVMRSVNGRNFTSVQKVNALGNGRSNNAYEATDINLSKLNSREVFYQIAQFDKDGTKTLSPVRKLSVDGLGKSVTAFPNPAKTTTKVVVDAPESGRGSLIMRDASGRQVQVMNAQFFKGINQFDMNVGALPSGEYNIQVSGGGLNETIKLTKIK